ncbi:MAG: FtsQ-type POTRA domain-containing protein [Candidatus Edwardsbacteria bacterium]|nr:FtsQ-type POTRA domain-containing protein [Candidatus Edwardsbacteria bacterium]
MIRPYFDKSGARRVRTKTRRRSLIKRILGAMLITGSIGLGKISADWSTRQGWFDISAVTVSGNRLVPAAEVMDVARHWLHKPIWTLDRARLDAALRRRHPAVKAADCMVWPWWTLTVAVREREAVVRLESDPAMVVSPEGTFFRDSGRSDRPSLRIAGTTEAGRMRAIGAVMQCPAPRPDWLFDPSDQNDVKLLADGTVVHLGNGDFMTAWRKFDEIMRDLGRNGTAASDIDLRYRDQGIVVLKDRSASAGNNKP